MWKILTQGRYSPEVTGDIFLSCCVLHNFLIGMRQLDVNYDDDLLPELFFEDVDDDQNVKDTHVSNPFVFPDYDALSDKGKRRQ